MALTKEQYNRIMRVLDERRSDAAQSLRARKEEIAGKIPAYESCGEELRKLNREEMKARFAGDTDAVRRLTEQREELIRTREGLLKEYGYPVDYLELPCTCRICGDTGFTENREKCSCFKKLEAELVNSEAGLPGFLGGADFDRIDTSVYENSAPMPDLPRGSKPFTQKQYMEQGILPAIRSYLDRFEEPGSHNLFLTGPAGTGKTYLTACIAGKVMEKLHTCIYIGAAELFELAANVTFGRGETEILAARLDTLTHCDLLIIDDLGTEFLTDLARTEMFSLISRRLSLGLSTIISSNMDLNTVEQAYGDRVASRIKGNYRILPFFGADLRLRRMAESKKKA